MSLPLAPSYAVLAAVQGAIVAAAWGTWRVRHGRWAALAAPAVALLVGVVVIRAWSGGAGAFVTLAALGTPVAAGLAGVTCRWRRPWWPAGAAASLFAVAWRSHGLPRDAASVALVALACVAVAGLVAAMTAPRFLALGIVLLVVLDVVLVLGVDAVRPASVALHAAAPLTVVGGGGVPLPALQDATFGGAIMGWLDLLAPALLATLMARQPRARAIAAVATTVAALAWGLLLLVRTEIPATVPALAGLGVWALQSRGHASGPIATVGPHDQTDT